MPLPRKKLQDMCERLHAVIHAVAHVEQLALGDAFKALDFFEPWKETLQEVYTYYHRSGKKREGLQSIAAILQEDLLKISGTHGIRWAAAQARTIVAVLTDLNTIVVDLEKTVKSELGMEYSIQC